MTKPQIDPVYTAAEAASYLRCHRKTLYRLTRRGQIAAMRSPGGRMRYRLSDLDAYLDAQRMPVKATVTDDIDWSA